MNMRKTLTASASVIALSALVISASVKDADAATKIYSGGTTGISAGELFSFTSVANSGDTLPEPNNTLNGWEHKFEAELAGVGTTRLSLTLLNFAGFTESITVQWLEANNTSSVIASTTLTKDNCVLDPPAPPLAQDGSCTTTLATSFPPLDQLLRLTWTPHDQAEGSVTISGSISVIPLPASALLLLGGMGVFGGMAAMRRRRDPASA